jgi:hypothetical protein
MFVGRQREPLIQHRHDVTGKRTEMTIN